MSIEINMGDGKFDLSDLENIFKIVPEKGKLVEEWAKIQRKMLDCLIKEGFTRAEAITILIAKKSE